MNTSLENRIDEAPVTTSPSPAAPEREYPVVVVRPRVDMLEHEAFYMLRAEMPGVDESHVDVQVERDILTLRAELALPTPEGFRQVYGTPHIRRYERAFRLADDVDHTAIDATVKNGLLCLKLPKLQPSVVKVSVKRAD